MELTTFGVALKYAINIETQAIEFYEDIAKYAEPNDNFMAFAAANKKRKAMLERLYNDNVYSDMDTGIFEPLAGLNGTEYFSDIKPAPETNYPDVLKMAIDVEEKTKRFYLDLAAQLSSRRSGVAKNFEKMVQENHDRKHKLESLLDKVS